MRPRCVDVAERRPARVHVVDHRGRELLHELDALAEEADPGRVLEDLDQHAEAHRPEDVARPGVALLAGLDDLGAGAALRERQPGVHGEGAPEQDDEEDAEEAADEQDEGRLPVVEARPQPLAPDVHHHEGGHGEDGPGGERLPHRGRRAHGVLLEDGAAEERQAEGGDREDGRGEGGRHRLAGLEAEVGVGGAEEGGDHDPEEERLRGQLRQALLGGYERLAVVGHAGSSTRSCSGRENGIRVRRGARRGRAAAPPAPSRSRPSPPAGPREAARRAGRAPPRARPPGGRSAA